jgi:hypothetical protein
MVVSTQFRAELDKGQTHQMVGIFQLRPQVFFEMYVEVKLWRDWLAANPSTED